MELVKREDYWALYNEDGHKIAATIDGCKSKLSLKNCEAIANGYDLDELSKKFAINELADPNEYEHSIYAATIQNTYMVGFKKALEILGDKKFSINEVVELCKILMSNPFEKCGKTYQELTDNYIQSLQQTEFDVEICCYLGNGDKESDSFKDRIVTNTGIPKLDSDGCLILKRI